MRLLITRILGYTRLMIRLNIIKTIYFNVKAFGWKDGLKLPVFFFGPVRFANMSGKIRIESEPVTRGMIQFGSSDENIIETYEPTRISVSGDLIFKGSCKFSKAVQLLVWNNGTLEIGNNAWFGSFCKIVSFQKIVIGENFMASWECQLFDTDFHFIKDVDANSISDNTAPVHIGNGVWLGSRVTVLKGTGLPDQCILATGSICNKDYRGIYPPNIVLGGAPAKLLKEKVQYISDKQLERKLFKHFQAAENRNSVYKLDL